MLMTTSPISAPTNIESVGIKIPTPGNDGIKGGFYDWAEAKEPGVMGPPKALSLSTTAAIEGDRLVSHRSSAGAEVHYGTQVHRDISSAAEQMARAVGLLQVNALKPLASDDEWNGRLPIDTAELTLKLVGQGNGQSSYAVPLDSPGMQQVSTALADFRAAVEQHGTAFDESKH